ncbi:glycosyl hydrolase family 76-domain-containing protein [Aspergillus crustosus]
MLSSALSVVTLALITSSTADTAIPTTAASISRAVTAAETLQTWYNPATGIWDTCGWWNGANCFTTIANLAALNHSEPVHGIATDVFQNTFSVAPNSNPNPARRGDSSYTTANGTAYVNSLPDGEREQVPTGAANASLWLDGSYDDDAWWGLAWIAAYDVTGQSEYLDLAEGIFYHLSNAWPSTCHNGGLDSDHTHVYVGAITNELFLQLAAQLSTRAHNSTYYLTWAKRQWGWIRDSGLINENHTINDGLSSSDCTNNGGTVWSYNQGVILGGLVELHRAMAQNDSSSSNSEPKSTSTSTSNSTFLSEAEKIAHGAITALVDDDGILHEPCESESCSADQTQFKGIFIRNLRVLHAVAPNDTYVKVINASAESIWEDDRTDENGFGGDWTGPVDGVNASTHGSAMDALVAAIWE